MKTLIKFLQYICGSVWLMSLFIMIGQAIGPDIVTPFFAWLGSGSIMLLSIVALWIYKEGMEDASKTKEDD